MRSRTSSTTILGASFRAAADDLLSVLNELAVARRERRLTIGEMPARSWVELTFINQLTYGWDLAVATGQDSRSRSAP